MKNLPLMWHKGKFYTNLSFQVNYSIKYQQSYNIPKTYLGATLKYMILILEDTFTQSKQLVIFSKKIQFKHAVMLHVVILPT